MSNQAASKLPLFVDMDGTLLATDTLGERLLQLVRKNPFDLFKVPAWLFKGRVVLKQQLAAHTELDIETLPPNPELLEFLKQQKACGRRLTLATASDRETAEKVAERFGLFDAVLATDASCNLKSHRKLAKMKEIASDGFAYAGNGYADLPIWKEADEVIAVSPGAGLHAPLVKMGARFFDLQLNRGKSWAKQLRVFQWMKNALIFTPLVLAHRLMEPVLLGQAALAIFSFSLLASSIYVINDLLDLGADRRHPRKKFRPLASGKLQPHEGVAVLPLLLLGSLSALCLLPPAFGWVWLTYLVLNLAYSLKLKRMFLLDVIVLSQMYPLRIFAGTAATGVHASAWLIAFAGCLFFSLAVVKRYAELKEVVGANGLRIKGRGYHWHHLKGLLGLGIGFAVLTVLVFIGYLHSAQVLSIYSNPHRLWGVALVLSYWLCRVWRLAFTGSLKDDPVEFALTDRQTYLAGAISLGIVIASC
ncbi:UbiA family prenyltransferase [Verrucomicrobiota bacterium]